MAWQYKHVTISKLCISLKNPKNKNSFLKKKLLYLKYKSELEWKIINSG